jgi:hypothetical protein
MGLRVFVRQITYQGSISHPFFVTKSFPSHEKQTTSFSASLYSSHWTILIIRSVLLILLSHLNGSDEATQPAASMTDSRTYTCRDCIYFLVQRVYFFPDSTSQSFSIFMSDISANVAALRSTCNCSFLGSSFTLIKRMILWYTVHYSQIPMRCVMTMYNEPDWSSLSVAELLEKAQEFAKKA